MSVAKVLAGLRPEWGRDEAANADEALERVVRNHPDIVLLDINMPGRDGLALAAELHAMNPDMPLAVISANIQEEIIARAREIGADFLPKPLTKQALAEFISSAERRLASTVG
jgi:CheY-like chemotaxis protein